jgi:hypothetical protein
MFVFASSFANFTAIAFASKIDISAALYKPQANSSVMYTPHGCRHLKNKQNITILDNVKTNELDNRERKEKSCASLERCTFR